MTTFIWALGLLGLLTWSGLCALGFWLLDGSGELLTRLAGTWLEPIPMGLAIIDSLTTLLSGAGAAIAWVVWALGAGFLVFGTWLLVWIVSLLRGQRRKSIPA
jgi:hypothetical protein